MTRTKCRKPFYTFSHKYTASCCSDHHVALSGRAFMFSHINASLDTVITNSLSVLIVCLLWLWVGVEPAGDKLENRTERGLSITKAYHPTTRKHLLTSPASTWREVNCCWNHSTDRKWGELAHVWFKCDLTRLASDVLQLTPNQILWFQIASSENVRKYLKTWWRIFIPWTASNHTLKCGGESTPTATEMLT